MSVKLTYKNTICNNEQFHNRHGPARHQHAEDMENQGIAVNIVDVRHKEEND